MALVTSDPFVNKLAEMEVETPSLIGEVYDSDIKYRLDITKNSVPFVALY